jgi:hypothetical protein
VEAEVALAALRFPYRVTTVLLKASLGSEECCSMNSPNCTIVRPLRTWRRQAVQYGGFRLLKIRQLKDGF